MIKRRLKYPATKDTEKGVELAEAQYTLARENVLAYMRHRVSEGYRMRMFELAVHLLGGRLHAQRKLDEMFGSQFDADEEEKARLRNCASLLTRKVERCRGVLVKSHEVLEKVMTPLQKKQQPVREAMIGTAFLIRELQTDLDAHTTTSSTSD